MLTKHLLGALNSGLVQDPNCHQAKPRSTGRDVSILSTSPPSLTYTLGTVYQPPPCPTRRYEAT